jgi:hypothetical protein
MSFLSDWLREQFQLDFQTLQDFCKTYDSKVLLTGSFALYGFLKQEGIEPKFLPGDLDIFVKVDNTENDYSTERQLHSMLENEDYFLIKTTHFENMNYQFGFRVINYYNTQRKHIQVVFVKCNSIKIHIFNNFDLSICATWWDPFSNTFCTVDKEMTKQMKMYQLNELSTQSKLNSFTQRLLKYQSRGFEFCDVLAQKLNKEEQERRKGRKPLGQQGQQERDEKGGHEAQHSLDSVDSLNNLDSLDSLNLNEVHDPLSLEDIPVSQYLKEYRWSIIIRSGQQLYGFDRNFLYNYLCDKRLQQDVQVTLSLDQKSQKACLIGGRTPLGHFVLKSSFEHIITRYDIKMWKLVPISPGDWMKMENLTVFRLEPEN